MTGDRPSVRVEVTSSGGGGGNGGGVSRAESLFRMLQIALFAAGVGLLVSNFVTLVHLYNYWDASTWPLQDVVVEISEVNHPDLRNIGCAMPHIEFRYDIDGTSHTSVIWGFTIQVCGEPAWASEIVSRYPKGPNSAYVDSEGNRAVLDPDVSALLIIAAGGPVCFLLLWASTFVRWRR